MYKLTSKKLPPTKNILTSTDATKCFDQIQQMICCLSWCPPPTKRAHRLITKFGTYSPLYISCSLSTWRNVQNRTSTQCWFRNLEQCVASEWALPCFTVSNEDNQVRQISNLCTLNMCTKHKNTHCLSSTMSCTVSLDTSILKTWYLNSIQNVRTWQWTSRTLHNNHILW